MLVSWRRRRRTRSLRRRSENGFSLVEALLALFVLLIVLAATANLVSSALTTGASSRLRQVATDIASSQLDADVDTAAATLLGESGFTSAGTVSRGGVTYTAELEVSPGAGACAGPQAGVPNELVLSVFVTWAKVPAASTWWSNTNYSSELVTESTYFPVPAAALVPDDGAILATVTDYAGNGQPLVVVTATNGTVTDSAITTDTGCVLFANIATGSWTVSATRSGWIDNNENLNTSATQSVTVTAGTVTSAVVKFAQAASLSAQYSVTPTGGEIGVTGIWNVPTFSSPMPLSLYNAALTTNPAVVVPPASVYPYGSSPSYTVVAGSCGASSAPDGSSTDGVTVNLTDGSSATAGFDLSPVEVVVTNGGNALSTATVTATPSTTTGATNPNCPTSGAGLMPTITLGVTCANGGTCAASTGYEHHASSTATPAQLVGWWGSWPQPRSSSHHRGTRDSGRWRSSRHHHVALVACYFNCGTTTTTTTAPTTTTTTVSSSANPSVVGQTVTYTAAVTATSGTPTGDVEFYSGGTAISSCTSQALSGSSPDTATCALSYTSPAADAITAKYLGASHYATSTSSALTQTVDKASTTVGLTSGTNPSLSGNPVEFTATVAPVSPGAGSPTGTVTFYYGSTNLGSGTLSNGMATYTTTGSQLPAGTDSITASYSGDANFLTSTSAALSQGVTANSAYVLSGLPYGTYKLSASYSNASQTYLSSDTSTVVVVVVQATGIAVYQNGVQVGSVITPSNFLPIDVPVAT